ncbi:MAG: DUF1385 domain-containing protein [Candidatus Coatesbacteria bacterium]|nr:DUF1385 domain-containing protein [Candidatus Coatesbacteria bacterium]
MPEDAEKTERKKKLIGGQAVINGVMMRGRRSCFMALRSPHDDHIELSELPLPRFLHWKIFRWPFLRGTSMILDSSVLGVKALTASANYAEKEEKKKEAAAKGESIEGIDEQPELLSGKRAALMLIPSLLLGIAFFILGPYWAARGLEALWPRTFLEGGVLFNLAEGLVRVLIFILYLVLIRRMEDVRTLFAYHGAEHKTIATFEADRELTPENARPMSRLHPRCGTGFLVFMLIALVLVHSLVFAIPGIQELTRYDWLNTALVILMRIALIPIVAGVAYEWIRLAGRYPNSKLARIFVAPGLATQLLTTVEPDDKQVECAMAAFKAVIDVEGAYEDPKDEKAPIAA